MILVPVYLFSVRHQTSNWSPSSNFQPYNFRPPPSKFDRTIKSDQCRCTSLQRFTEG